MIELDQVDTWPVMWYRNISSHVKSENLPLKGQVKNLVSAAARLS